MALLSVEMGKLAEFLSDSLIVLRYFFFSVWLITLYLQKLYVGKLQSTRP